MKKYFILFILICSIETSWSQEPAEQNVIRVMTFNILHGATTKNDFDLDKIADVINKYSPDLVALQEVDFKTRRAKNYDLATELGLRTKMAPLFGKAMDYDGGGYGEGILTVMPIISSRTIALPHSPENEPRAALEVTVELQSGDTICFIGTHFEHQTNNPDRIAQAKKLNEVFLKNKFPTILAGDLNATPESEPIQVLKQYWSDSSAKNPQPTFSSKNPVKKIDYILYYPEKGWKVLETKVICDSVASDHCALLSVLQLVK
ncbi:MAG: endonuclease/exonuclease/phosphatase family protein [Draconibacterium sp.]